MRPKNNLFFASALLIFLVGVFSLPATARQEEMAHLGKKGEIRFDSSVWVGEVLLKPGDYQIQHRLEGQDHVIVFRKLLHPPGGLGRGPLEPGKEVARVKCRVEPLGEKAKHHGIRFGTNAAGEKTVEEVHIQGESVKHVF